MRRTVVKLVCLAALPWLLWQCAPHPKAPAPYASTVRLAFTPKSQAAMARYKDNIAIVAYYYGDPVPQHKEPLDPAGRLILGEERHGWTANARRAPLDGAVDAALLPQIRGPVQMLVTAYSVQPVGASDDIIHCKSWIGTVKEAQERSPLVACEMEDNDTDSADDIVAADEASSH